MSCEVINEPDNVIIAKLAELSLSQTTYSHPESFTIEAQAIHVASVPGSLTKNLFLRDKKHGLFLITTRDTQEVNLKVVANLLNLAGANMRFGDAELLKEKLGVIQGCISPFALINDINKEVKFCIDKSLLSEDVVNMHPLRNDRTTSISPTDLLSFLDNIEHKPILLDFSTAVPLPPAPVQITKAVKAEKEKKEEPKKGETLLGLSVTKEGDFSAWYTQVITLSEMIDYSDISGCYILRPWSFHIWESIQSYFDGKIKELGVKNAYFPLFVSEKALNTEKDHIEGFAPEVAWVTKSGDKDLPEKIGIRPTSETIIYPFFAKWIRSHRDLPMELNQWSNVVRWEFKDATPFLRSREFLWQEGHTAHQTYEEAQERVLSILDLYESVYEYLLAVPVVKGIKTEQEKFAGAHHTTTVEAYINGSGRAIQGATSHNLGLSFGKMFDISYEDDQGKKNIPWQTSWGLTTRSIGVCVMVHGDDKGLVLPPRVAPIQVIICPIQIKNCDYAELLAYSENVRITLKKLKIRVDIDARQNYTPGWRFNHWEQKGVPIRIEIGPRDIANNQLRIVRRDNSEKSDINLDDITTIIPDLLEVIQNDMLNKARVGRDEKLVQVTEWKDFVPALDKKCLIMTPFCDEKEWEDKVKKMSKLEALNGGEEAETCATSAGAKTLCKPLIQPPLPEGTKCFISGKPATTWVMWGRSY